MKYENDKSTIEMLEQAGAEHGVAPGVMTQLAAIGQKATNEIMADDENRVSGRRFKGSKTPDKVRQKWRTPEWLFAWARKRFGEFGIDVAAEKINALCACYLDRRRTPSATK
ncbi:hypothetical protein sortkaff_33 [Escherichia phage sortkaff]|uniref:Uncharacterized protein n=1 Tax=Escherichia phage sortkaff TaxID=2696445 RepID=A0A6C0R052_9CAUD|nr:hypothetical protein sortkaff_33 [Escherichia phage sortkaff]